MGALRLRGEGARVLQVGVLHEWLGLLARVECYWSLEVAWSRRLLWTVIVAVIVLGPAVELCRALRTGLGSWLPQRIRVRWLIGPRAHVWLLLLRLLFMPQLLLEWVCITRGGLGTWLLWCRRTWLELRRLLLLISLLALPFRSGTLRGRTVGSRGALWRGPKQVRVRGRWTVEPLRRIGLWRWRTGVGVRPRLRSVTAAAAGVAVGIVVLVLWSLMRLFSPLAFFDFVLVQLA